jgi:tRNA(Ile)-lysidine synthase
LRRYRGLLFALPPQADAPPIPDSDWMLPDALDLGDGRVLRIAGSTPGRLLKVRARRGGESLVVAGNRPRRDLRLLFQEQGVPPWQRERLPYVYDGATLVAVGDRFVEHEFARWLQSHDAQLIFQDTSQDPSPK